MSQTLDNLSTGVKGLDKDLRELFVICEDEKKLDTIKQAIANKEISSEEFSKVVPDVLVKLSYYLDGPRFVILSEQVNEEAIDLCKDAKLLLEKHFGNLFENENAKSMLRSNVTTKAREQIDSLADETIRGIGYYFMWEDDPPELTPAVRIAFKNKKGKILLNTRLDWDDFSFLVSNLAEILVELLEKGKTLAELGQIDLSYSQKVLKRIEETSETLQKTNEIMPIYTADTETDKNEQSVNDSSG